jgi:hypothetical protein
MRTILLCFLALAAGGASVQAAELFPLQPGSRWEYRADGVAEPLVVQVGWNQLYLDGRVYSRLTGYVEQPLWVRLGDDGDIYFLDEETSQERFLTMLHVDTRFWFEAPFRACDQEGQTHSDTVPYSGPTGRLNETTAVRYRSFNCADVGVETEQFAANIGMVSRTVTTFAGPLEYKLVYADTGAVQAAPRKGATLRLSLERNPDRPSLKATLRLTSDADTAERLVFPTSQEFDMRLRDASGAVVWTWSDGEFFTPSIHEREAVNLVYEAEIPLDRAGPPLPGGDYVVEAWLTIADIERAPRITTAYRVEGQPEAKQTVRPLRARR